MRSPQKRKGHRHEETFSFDAWGGNGARLGVCRAGSCHDPRETGDHDQGCQKAPQEEQKEREESRCYYGEDNHHASSCKVTNSATVWQAREVCQTLLLPTPAPPDPPEPPLDFRLNLR